MNTYQLIVAYDGTNYCGWQQQPNQRSVLGEMHKQFERAFKTPITLLGASRTDAGVHALGQVVRAQTSLEIDADKLAWVWNNALPNDIVIKKIIKQDNTYHPHGNVKQKTYWYQFFTDRPMPFDARYGWYLFSTIDHEKLNDTLQLFVGTHDFRAFCCAEDKLPDTVRTIDKITIEQSQEINSYHIYVQGQKFLRHMIRRIVGASIHAATHPNITLHDVQNILENKNPNHPLPNAPAHGLTLAQIIYHKGTLHEQTK